MNRYRWAWFVLACLVTAAWAWTNRYEYRECRRNGCMAINRWTGKHLITERAAAGEREEIRPFREAQGPDAASLPAENEPNRWAKYAEP